MNHPFVECKLKGLTGPLPFGVAPLVPFPLGMTKGWVLCLCNGGGLTLETLFLFARVRLVGPPFVLGGFAFTAFGFDVEVLDRERDREAVCDA